MTLRTSIGLFLCAACLMACERDVTLSPPALQTPSPEPTPLSSSVAPIEWMEAGPVRFDPSGARITVAKSTSSAQSEIRYWTENAHACGPDRPAGYWQQFESTFKETEWTVFILLQGRTPVATIVTVPNVMQYQTLETFEEDFFACDIGVPRPTTFNDEWLVLTLNAGGGTDAAIGELAEDIIRSIRL